MKVMGEKGGLRMDEFDCSFLLFLVGIVGSIAVGVLWYQFVYLEPQFFCSAHKPSEDFVLQEWWISGDDRLHCEFETKSELPYKHKRSVYFVTKEHGYVCDYWCYGDVE